LVIWLCFGVDYGDDYVDVDDDSFGDDYLMNVWW